ENGSQRIHEKIFRCQPPATPYATLMSQVAGLKRLLNAPPTELRGALTAAVNVWVEDLDKGQRRARAA
ncbi:MAG: hypothetical protein B7Z55_12140, partial [Planctomycetales bacterium 12-60-4]